MFKVCEQIDFIWSEAIEYNARLQRASQKVMKQNLATVIYGTLTTRLYYSITPSVGQPLKIESIYWFNMLAAGIDYKDHIFLVLKECS